MKKLDQFVDNTGDIHDVAEGDGPAFEGAMQQKGLTFEPLTNYVDQDNNILPVAQSDMDAFHVKMQTTGRQVQPLRQVVLDNGDIHEVADSDRGEFLKAYQSAAKPEFKADRDATQTKIATQQNQQQKAQDISQVQKIRQQVNPTQQTATVGSVLSDPFRGLWDSIRYGGAQNILDTLDAAHVGDWAGGAAQDIRVQRATAGYEQPKTPGIGGEILHGVGSGAGTISRMMVPYYGLADLGMSITSGGQETYRNLIAKGKTPTEASEWAFANAAVVGIPMIIAQRIGAGAEAKAAGERILAAMTQGDKVAAGKAILKAMGREVGAWAGAGALTGAGAAELQKLSGENPDANVALEGLKGAINYGLGALAPFALRTAATARKSTTRPTSAPSITPPTVPDLPPMDQFTPPLEPSATTPATPPEVPNAPEPGGPAAISAAIETATTKPSTPTPEPETSVVADNHGVAVPARPVNMGEVAIKPDLMQFKRVDDSATGENTTDQLKGKWDDTKGGAVLLWEPTNPAEYGLSEGQKYITANGHHRVAFAERQGRKGINAQILREADGITAADARSIAAEANIADGKGTVNDHAKYWRNASTALGTDAALGRASTTGARGRQGASIGVLSGQNLFDAFVNEKVSPEQAQVIAESAPHQDGLQRVGIAAALKDMKPGVLGNFMQAVKARMARSKLPQEKQLDLFGSDDTAILAMEEQAHEATRIQNRIREQIKSVQSAAMRPSLAAKLGVNVKDPQGVQKKVEALKAELDRWHNWPMEPDLVAQTTGGPAHAEDVLNQHAREALGMDISTPSVKSTLPRQEVSATDATIPADNATPPAADAPAPSPADAAASAVRTQIATLFPGHADRVAVVNTGADLPDAVRLDAQRRMGEGGHNQVEAVWHDGKVYITAANVSPERVAPLIFHEVGIHEGLRRALGTERFGALMDQIAASLSPEDRQAIAGKYRLSTYTEGWQREAGEEWLARMAEDAKSGGRWKSIFDRVVSSVNDFARILGVKVRYGEAEVRDMLRKGMRASAMERGEPTPVNDTPADRMRFSLVTRAWNDLTKERRTIAAELRSFSAKALMSATRDRADNAAKIYAKAASNDPAGILARAMGRPTRSINRRDNVALTAMRESGDNLDTLKAFVPQLEAIIRNPKLENVRKNAKEYLAGVTHAIDNFDKLLPASAEYHRATMTQYNAENAGGVKTALRGNYVYHAQEREPWTSMDREGSGIVGNFLRQRTAGDTFVDSMTNGVNPVTLDSIDLLRGRIDRGQRMLNMKQWTDAFLPTINDPTTHKPIMVEMLPADPSVPGQDHPTAPPGYRRIDVGMGKSMAIHEGYSGIFNELTGQSSFDQSYLGRSLMKGVGLAKHMTLLGDTFHLGRVAYNVFALTGTPGYKRGVLLLDYSTPELTRMAQHGEIDPQILPDLIREKADLGLLVNHGLNVGGIADAFSQEWVQKYSPLHGFNKWLFESYQRGAMARAALIELRLQRKMNPAATQPEIARQVAFSLNTKFGNLGRQGWIKDPTFLDLFRVILLAPGWNEGLLRSQLQSIRDIVKVPLDLASKKRIIIGTQLRVAGTLLAASFIANQIINQVTRKKFTWENPEEGIDAKISAWVPDEIGDGPGMFMSPAAIPAEIAHQIGERWEKTGRLDKAIDDVLRYKISPGARMMRVLLLREDQFGKATHDAWDTIKTAAGEGVPTPIGGSAIYRAGRQLATGTPSELFPGQFQKQVLASVGIKTTGAPDPHQRIASLAADFKAKAGVPNDPAANAVSPYRPFMKAIEMGNLKEAADQLKILRNGSWTEDQLRHYVANAYPRSTITGSTFGDQAFYQTLTTEQQQQFQKARERRWETARKAIEYLIAHPPADGASAIPVKMRMAQMAVEEMERKAGNVK